MTMALRKSSLLDSIGMEILIRVVLFIIFVCTDEMEPFHRIIQPEEWWLYNNPRTDSYISTNVLYVLVTVVPFSVIGISFCLRRDLKDTKQATLAYTLGLIVNCAITNGMKLTVGRPRPDFLARCYPNGVPKTPTINLECDGVADIIKEGRKSFPSGHSSFIFAAYGFVSLYLAGKLHTFEGEYKGHSWRLLVAGSPLFAALLSAISRTMDYHHHWQDVLVGSTLGFFCAIISYYQYYPGLKHPDCDKPIQHKVLLKLPRTMSDSRISKGVRTWGLQDSEVDSVPLIEVKEM